MTFTENYLYESVTEHEINKPKRYDMKLGGAKQLVVSGYDGDKICIRLASNTLEALQKDFKVEIDDTRSRLDVDISRQNGMTEATAKEAVTVFVQIPSSYIRKVELAVHAETVEVYSLNCDSIELNIRTQNIVLEDVVGTVEIDCNLDMNVVCRSLEGEIAINQVSSTSKISIPEKAAFKAVTKGIGTSISFEKNGQPSEAFDSPNADNIIELNGMKSELIISASEK